MAAMDTTDKSLWWRPGSAVLFGVKETPRRGPGLRLPIAAIAVLAGLGLFCGNAQAGRWLPTIENPYCPVTTYTLRDLAEQASSMTDSNGHPVIVVNLRMLREQPSYGKFLMAHECCHHSLGHVGKFRNGLGGVGPQPFLYIAPALKRLELEADCCAVKLLRERHEADSIEAARSTMATFGSDPTGAYYPTGNERAANISVCASPDD
jgi:hypothetical protein